MKLLWILFAAVPIISFAQELPKELSVNGISYRNVEFQKRDPARVTFSHADGITTVKIEELPAAIQKQFPVNQTEAARFLNEQSEKDREIFFAAQEGTGSSAGDEILSKVFRYSPDKGKELICEFVSSDGKDGAVLQLRGVRDGSTYIESPNDPKLEMLYVYGDFSQYVPGDRLKFWAWRAGVKTKHYLFSSPTYRAFATSPELALQVSDKEK